VAAAGLNRWNHASSRSAFSYLHTPISTPSSHGVPYPRQRLGQRRSGLWDDGDQLTSGLTGPAGGQTAADHQVDADGSASTYYIYFDTCHEASPPALASLGAATLTGTAGGPEAGAISTRSAARARPA